MTPVLDSFKIPKELTGDLQDRTINPSELNLWRVLQINLDGTIDLISKYTSSVGIIFRGQTGYKNYVGALNLIASAYTNSVYTTGSRCIGSEHQTEFIMNDLTVEKSGTSTTAISSWDSSTEPYGGGSAINEWDKKNIDKISELYTYKVNTTEEVAYWYGLRYYVFDNNVGSWYVRVIARSNPPYNLYKSDGTALDGFAYIRPIVTLKANLTTKSGDGTEGNPWAFE